MKIRIQADFWTGIMFLAIGTGAALVSRGYDMGTAHQMGPGYFPFLLGIILDLLGLFVLVGSLGTGAPDAEHISWHPKVLGIIVFSIVAFGLALETLGLVIALCLVLGISAFASHEFSWRTTFIVMATLIPFSVLVFVYGLGLPMALWPSFGH